MELLEHPYTQLADIPLARFINDAASHCCSLAADFWSHAANEGDRCGHAQDEAHGRRDEHLGQVLRAQPLHLVLVLESGRVALLAHRLALFIQAALLLLHLVPLILDLGVLLIGLLHKLVQLLLLALVFLGEGAF